MNTSGRSNGSNDTTIKNKAEVEVRAITDILMKYCEPKPELSGIMAKDVAKKILEVIKDK